MRHPLSHLLTIIALTLLTWGCSQAEMTPTEPDSDPEGAPIMFGGWAADGSSWHNGRPGARATGDIEAAIPDNIGVFAFGDGPNTTYIFRNQKVMCRDNREYLDNPFTWDYPATPIDVWPYTTEAGSSIQRPWEKMRYRFFAYSPWTETERVSVTSENYSGFNTFIWSDIPGFTAADYVLTNDITDLDNREGAFTSMGNVVTFSLRHILSQVRFFFRLSPDYRQVRRIELNSLTVLTAGKVKSATFNFKDNAWDETVHWSDEQLGDCEPVTLTSLTSLHYYLPAEYPDDPFASVYVYPQDLFSELQLRLSYTVYDSAGQPTRQAQVVNTVTLPDWTLLAGYYYDIRILVAPQYLYVMSDNDQDFDGYVIIRDTPTE